MVLSVQCFPLKRPAFLPALFGRLLNRGNLIENVILGFQKYLRKTLIRVPLKRIALYFIRCTYVENKGVHSHSGEKYGILWQRPPLLLLLPPEPWPCTYTYEYLWEKSKENETSDIILIVWEDSTMQQQTFTCGIAFYVTVNFEIV